MRTNYGKCAIQCALVLLGAAYFSGYAAAKNEPFAGNQWSPDQAKKWYSQQPWLTGSNYISSTAINELEMWQPDTFDLPTVDRELGWAQALGMNTMRVFLHNLLWQQDSQGFLHRMDQFLAVADQHHIRIMFVLLDSVWDPHPHLGKQPAPQAARSQLRVGAGARGRSFERPIALEHGIEAVHHWSARPFSQ
jgi:hypothetical protein